MNRWHWPNVRQHHGFGDRPFRRRRRSVCRLGVASAVVLLLAAMFLAVGENESRKTRRWIEASASGIADDDGLGRRRVYGLIVRLAGLLYFAMLPVIIALGAAVSVLVTGVLVVCRRIPIGLLIDTAKGVGAT
jgi:hypothetical protein